MNPVSTSSPSAFTLEQVTGQTMDHLQPYGDHWLHKSILNDVQALQSGAQQAGFELTIASGFRSFERQLQIWNGKFRGERPLLDANSQPLAIEGLSDLEKTHAILHWSALPGASRHHWGTDMDVYCKLSLPHNVKLQLEPWEYENNGHQAALAEWLNNNMHHYGFYLPYAQDQGGVAREPWHLSHYAQSQSILDIFTLSQLRTVLSHSEIEGKDIILTNLDDIYSRYISNVSPLS